MDAVRKLIRDKLEELGLTMSEASQRIGRNHAYLQQFLKRGVPAELGEREREQLAELLSVPQSALRGTSEPLPKREYVKAPTAGPARATIRPSGNHNSLDTTIPAAQLYVDRDLPVYGTALDGHGVLIVTNHAIDWATRPMSLLRVEEAYGMIITGDAMSPKIESGDTVLFNPHLPPKPGNICIFRRRRPDGSVEARLLRLDHFTKDVWHVHQSHPRKNFDLKRSDWQTAHVATDVHFAR